MAKRRKKRISPSMVRGLSGLGNALSKVFGGPVSVCVPGPGGGRKGSKCYPRRYSPESVTHVQAGGTRKKISYKTKKGTYSRTIMAGKGGRTVYAKVSKRKAGPGSPAQRAARARMAKAGKACAGQPARAFRACVRKALKG